MTVVEARLADFVVGTQWSDLPEATRAAAVDLFIDALACAYTGRTASGRETFAGAANSVGGAGDHTVVGDAGGTSLLAAGMLNAWQVTATTMCDVYRPAMCHVTPLALAASLAGADLSGGTVEDLLLAFALGVEVTLRLCSALDQPLYRGPRWHAPGVVGPFGAAATFGRLLGVDATTLRSSWGAALLHSAGTFSAIGTPGVKLTQARGAAAGIQSVIFARAAHGGSPDAFSHPDGGLFDAYAGGDITRATAGLGAHWRFDELSLRRWPASSSLQSVIAAVLDLRGAAAGDLSIELPPQSYKLCGTMPWSTQLGALQSAAWVAASTWTDGRCWIDQFEIPALADPTKNALAAAITVTPVDDLPEGAARVRVGGSVAERLVAPGSPEDPLSSADIRDKLVLAAGQSGASAILNILKSPATTSSISLLEQLRETGA